jgi:hypothetical protein
VRVIDGAGDKVLEDQTIVIDGQRTLAPSQSTEYHARLAWS